MLAQGDVEDSQTEGAEDGHSGLALPWRGRAFQDLREGAADEVARAGELLGQVNRGLGPGDVIDIVHDVVAAEDGPRGQVAQGHVEDRRARRAGRQVLDVRPDGGGRKRDQGAAPEDGLDTLRDLDLGGQSGRMAHVTGEPGGALGVEIEDLEAADPWQGGTDEPSDSAVDEAGADETGRLGW